MVSGSKRPRLPKYRDMMVVTLVMGTLNSLIMMAEVVMPEVVAVAESAGKTGSEMLVVALASDSSFTLCDPSRH